MNQINENIIAADKDIELSIVVPCYNEEEVIEHLINRVIKVAQATLANNKFELILINDGSTDTTWKKISQHCHHKKNIIGIKLSRNFGHQTALSVGLKYVSGDMVLILDADLQDPPELLPEMVKILKEGADVVYGQRIERKGETWFKKISAKIFYRLLNKISEVEIPIDTGDFKLMKKHICDNLQNMPEKQRFVRGLIAWQGYNQVAIQYNRQERYAGKSKYPLSKMIGFALDAVTSFSISPLKISSNLSILSATISFLLFIYVIFSWLLNDAVPGWASIGTIITLLGAAQLLVLGIIGEYVGRIYIESKNRPLFIIEKVLNKKES